MTDLSSCSPPTVTIFGLKHVCSHGLCTVEDITWRKGGGKIRKKRRQRLGLPTLLPFIELKCAGVSFQA
jgi:hypothetical protein